MCEQSFIPLMFPFGPKYSQQISVYRRKAHRIGSLVPTGVQPTGANHALPDCVCDLLWGDGGRGVDVPGHLHLAEPVHGIHPLDQRSGSEVDPHRTK